jgi:hypothetical protein
MRGPTPSQCRSLALDQVACVEATAASRASEDPSLSGNVTLAELGRPEVAERTVAPRGVVAVPVRLEENLGLVDRLDKLAI